jgi:uncharacterized protein (TIGR02145 family)
MLPNITTYPSNNSIIEKWCYNNDPAICATDGGFYWWDEAMQYVITEGAQGICPTGWHIPTDAQLYALENYLHDEGESCLADRHYSWACDTAGTKLKLGGSSGYGCVLTGYKYLDDGDFITRGLFAWLWSSTVIDSTTAQARAVLSLSSTVYRSGGTKTTGFSVRCLKD